MHMVRRFRERRITLAAIATLSAAVLAVQGGVTGYGPELGRVVWSAAAAAALAGLLLTIMQEITDRIEHA